jgi:hypothetical protein
MYVYDAPDADPAEDAAAVGPLFRPAAPSPSTGSRRDGITDAGLAHFQSSYPGEAITKEDVFYYVYGILHSADYRERYADNLGKELPRIPRVKTAADFWAFSKAGRALGDLHVGYEQVEPYPAIIEVRQGGAGVDEKRKARKKAGAPLELAAGDSMPAHEGPLPSYGGPTIDRLPEVRSRRPLWDEKNPDRADYLTRH